MHRQSIVRGSLCVATVLFLFLALSSLGGGSHSGGSGSNPASDRAWNKAFPLARSRPADSTYRVAIIADLDKKSKVDGSKKPKWKSYLQEGELKKDGDTYTIKWDDRIEITTSFGEAGRGMELSELAVFEERLWTFDDRSGIAFEITADHKAIPRSILMEGDGNIGKGQKTEWATVKDDKLFVGSFGKEYVNNTSGEITSLANLWVSTIDNSFSVDHEDWQHNYEALREKTNTKFPGYMIIEAIEWSDAHQRWFVLPRRVSPEPYDEELDESRGSNIVLSADADFNDVKQWTAGTLRPTHGFSSFAFFPGSKDSIVVALKTEEKESAGTQTTHLMVFELETGKVLLDETEIPGGMKFEGITFV